MGLQCHSLTSAPPRCPKNTHDNYDHGIGSISDRRDRDERMSLLDSEPITDDGFSFSVHCLPKTKTHTRTYAHIATASLSRNVYIEK